MGYQKELFGEMPDGRKIFLYTLRNRLGMEASFTDLGAVWVSMKAPSSNGELVDVVLGYDSGDEYLVNRPHFGAPVGRNANRIGGAKFILNGKTYSLAANNGSNNLHSGPYHYHTRQWEAQAEEGVDGTELTFSLFSPDGDQGYPGNARISVGYRLTEEGSVKISYHMISDEDTLANFTNHSYFNLAGHGSGSAMDQLVWIDADAFTPADETAIPTGEIRPVEGTPMDFRSMKPIARDLDDSYEALIKGKGYDHNWVLNHMAGELSVCARAKSVTTGIAMEVWTDLPGLQFYTANFLDCGRGKGKMEFGPRCAYCFETQHFPNAVNTPGFPSPVLKKGKEYKTNTIYKFSTEA